MDAEVGVSCAHCGEPVEQPFTCSHCDQQYCSDHRLPEEHKCPLFVPSAADTPTRSEVHAERAQGSSVKAPESMDLDGQTTAKANRSAPTTSSPDVSLKESSTEPTSESQHDLDGLRLYTRLGSLYAGAAVRTSLRRLGLVAVLVAVYHLFVPIFAPAVPIWAPWRVFGLWIAGEGTVVYLGDVLLLVAGAVVTWFL